jgi:hypothetical protein
MCREWAGERIVGAVPAAARRRRLELAMGG